MPVHLSVVCMLSHLADSAIVAVMMLHSILIHCALSDCIFAHHLICSQNVYTEDTVNV